MKLFKAFVKISGMRNFQHCVSNGAVPVAVTLNITVDPESFFSRLIGCAVTCGGIFSVKCTHNKLING